MNTNMNETKKHSPEALRQFEIIKRGAHEILPEAELLDLLEKSITDKKPLRVKAGFDPTAPDLHLGHLVLLRKLKHFQDLGHEILFLIGDFTGMIGDPTGRSATRKAMTREDVAENAKTYQDQVFRILDKNKTKIVFNSEWCASMNFQDVLGLTARYTVARMIERDDFSKRLAAGEPISLIELMYPLVQGYDSVILKSDIELGGTDQKFNLLVGRELQSQYNIKPQIILTTPLLVGLDGQRKMSKSYGNYIGINEKPYTMFAKIMSVSDELMWDYYEYLTDVPKTEITNLKADPFAAKKNLAVLITEWLHPGEGEKAKDQWESEKSSEGRTKLVLPPETPVLKIIGKSSVKLAEAVLEAGLESSLSAIKRLIESKSVKIGENLDTVEDREHILNFPGRYEIKIGKKKYLVVEG
jgi:tyrosyl-tRNA synthetase